MRADALNTVWRQFGLLRGNEIRQTLPDLGIGEDPLAVLADEGPSSHTRLWRPGRGRENTQVRVPFYVTGWVGGFYW
jgi:hypothetical protein